MELVVNVKTKKETKQEVKALFTSAEVEKISLSKELKELLNWFNEYDNQVKQYLRCVRLGIEFDKNIADLDNQAKINQARISEIRKKLEVTNETNN